VGFIILCTYLNLRPSKKLNQNILTAIIQKHNGNVYPSGSNFISFVPQIDKIFLGHYSLHGHDIFPRVFLFLATSLKALLAAACNVLPTP